MKYTLINSVIRNNYSTKLMEERGVIDLYSFLNPTKEQVQSCYDLDNIEAAGQLLKNTLEKPDHCIFIIPDSDTDGLTSASMLWQYILDVFPSANLQYLIHSNKEHGLEDCTNDLINYHNDQHSVDLVILPDAGSNDFEYFQQLTSLGIAVLVIDHHEAEVRPMENVIIVNNQQSEYYRNKSLTGSGMVWQFCNHLDDIFNLKNADNYIDLAALGIVADLQSVIEPENRYIIAEGLANIKNQFFQALIDKQSYSMEGLITPIKIGFYIAPLINGMIRVGTAYEKEKLFLAFLKPNEEVESTKRGAKGTKETRAIQMARECGNAKSRQDKQKENILNSIEIKIANNNLLDHKILFIKLEEEDVFPATLNGLIAMYLTQKYQRPAIVARMGADGMVKGSLRGLNNSMLSSFKDYLESTGLFEYCQGHANAAGISIKNSNIPALYNVSDKELADYDFGEIFIKANFIFHAGENIEEAVYDLDKLKTTYGTNNDEPIVVVENLHLTKDKIEIIGQYKNTVRFQYNNITYLIFFAKDFIKALENAPEQFDLTVAGTSDAHWYNGNVTPQIKIKYYEIKPSSLYEF